MAFNVAIDGPAGAGKSSAAKLAAKRLGFIYVDTGALYRAVGLYSIRRGLDTRDAESVVNTLGSISIELKYIEGAQRVFLNGEDVSEAIRTPEASMGASNVSAIPEVRSFLFDLQRGIAARNDCIMDGRDIGTVVLPDAEVKIFLTASPEDRADRRLKELINKGETVDRKTVLDDINKRDYQDTHRKTSPLVCAEDAVYLDNGSLDLEQTANRIIEIVKEKM